MQNPVHPYILLFFSEGASINDAKPQLGLDFF